MKYERLTVWVDPYDIMCGECQEHEYETWNEVTAEELKEDYEMEMAVSKIDPMMDEPAGTFDEWLKDNIATGWIREVA